MALTITGGLVVSGVGQPHVEAFGDLKKCVARTFQGESQPQILELAGYGIRRAIDWVNMSVKLRCGSKQASDANLVAGTAGVTLGSDFFAVQEVQLIDSDGNVHSTLNYLPWGQFNEMEQRQNAEGKPLYWTSRNTFDDGEILLYPVPDSGAATDYDVRVTYYERVNMPSADGDIVDAPRELGLVLCTYAESYVAYARNREDAAAWGSKKREAEKLLARFVNSTEEEPTATLQWRMAWDTTGYKGFDPLGD